MINMVSDKDADVARALLVWIALKIAAMFVVVGVITLPMSALSRSTEVALVAFGLIGVGATTALGVAAWWWLNSIWQDALDYIAMQREKKGQRAFENMMALGASPMECAEARDHVLGVVPKLKPISDEKDAKDTKANW